MRHRSIRLTQTLPASATLLDLSVSNSGSSAAGADTMAAMLSIEAQGDALGFFCKNSLHRLCLVDAPRSSMMIKSASTRNETKISALKR